MTQADALTILKSGANVFLTGEPGSGKSHTVNEYVKYLRERGIEPSITASTGIAATHIHGMTIHAWSGIGIASSLSPADLDRIATREHVVRRIRPAKVLIIDEISMLSRDTLDMVEAVVREVKQVQDAFGGMQVIFVGDFFQLPPIVRPPWQDMTTDIFYSDVPESIFAFASGAWRRANPIVCYLTEQHRQDDENFLSVLSAIRTNTLQKEHHAHIRKRTVSSADDSKGVTKLFSHNADVDRINAQELKKLPGNPKRFQMSSHGRDTLVETLKRGCLSPDTLELKEGAVVMFTKNSVQGGFVNGTLGVVDRFMPGSGSPQIRTFEGKLIVAEPLEWSIEDNGKVLATIAQIPLRLAWAMTVHKSQGMSLDAAVMDLSQAFEYGQGYVALSRVRRLRGLFLLGINKKALEVHPEIFEKDAEFRELSEAAEQSFGSMSEDDIRKLHDNFMRASGGNVSGEEKEKKKVIRSNRTTKSGKQKKEPSPEYAAKLAVMRAQYPRAYTPWTDEDDTALTEAFKKNPDQQALSKTFERQPGSIQARLVKLGLIEDTYKKLEDPD